MVEELSIDDYYTKSRERGKILGLECDLGHVTVPPRHSCRVCGARNLKVKQVEPVGVLLSFTQVYSKSGEFPLSTPYTLGLVKLNEGGNLVGIISGNESVPRIGAKVKIRFESIPQDSVWPRVLIEII